MNIDIDGINIKYPDLGFAFNPIRVFIDNYNESVIFLESNGIKIEREIPPGQSSASFELAIIAKSLFDRFEFYKVEHEDTTLFKTLEFTISSETDVIYTGSIPIIWGALQIGEVYTQNKTLTYFKGFPFTLPFYVDEGNLFLQYSADGVPYQDIGAFGKGKYNIDVTTFNASRKIEFRSQSEETYKIFDYTFDYTFGPQKIIFHDVLDIIINIEDCPNEGVYLRWINKFGEYNYYLFRSSADSITTKNNSIFFDELFYTTAFTDNHHNGTGKTIGKDIEQSVKLFASLIDENTYKHLIGLVESPVVDMLAGYDDDNKPNWMSVSVAEGTFSKSTDHLQDFELFMIPNKTQIQNL